MVRVRPNSMTAWLVVCFLSLALAACSGSATPQLIGSYPRNAGASPTYAPPRNNLLVAYGAYMELEVADVDYSAERAAYLAYTHGGYLVASQSWYRGSLKYTTLTFAVPAGAFESLRQALRDLGSLSEEHVSAEFVSSGHAADGWTQYPNITVQLRPTGYSPQAPAGTGWNPVRTFERAFVVFTTIFQFAIDLLIWVLVVAGPFALMGYGLWALVHRYKSRRA